MAKIEEKEREFLDEFSESQTLQMFSVIEREYDGDIRTKRKMGRMMRNAAIITFLFFFVVELIKNRTITFDMPIPSVLSIMMLLFISFSMTREIYETGRTEFLFNDKCLYIFRKRTINGDYQVIYIDRINYSDISKVTYNQVDKKLTITGSVMALDYTLTDDAEEVIDEITFFGSKGKNAAIYFDTKPEFDFMEIFRTYTSAETEII